MSFLGTAAAADEADSESKKSLTDEQIKGLKTKWVNEKTGEKVTFNVSFGAKYLKTAKDKAPYIGTSKIPVRVTAALYVLRKGQKRASRVPNGETRFIIRDSANTTLYDESASYAKLCPS
jgi:hypothetical protein